MKYISIREFRDLGYIHEINRTILHPVGLALETRRDDDDGNLFISGIQDHRDDPEGMCYGDDLLSPAKADTVARIASERHLDRVTALGYWIQPVSND